MHSLRCDGKRLSPGRRPREVVIMTRRYTASKRRVCRLVVGQYRSSQRHSGKVRDLEEVKLRHRLSKLNADHGRWGGRKAYQLQRRR
jgi:putative transposase